MKPYSIERFEKDINKVRSNITKAETNYRFVDNTDRL